jgi:hypothetical protein
VHVDSGAQSSFETVLVKLSAAWEVARGIGYLRTALALSCWLHPNGKELKA